MVSSIAWMVFTNVLLENAVVTPVSGRNAWNRFWERDPSWENLLGRSFRNLLVDRRYSQQALTL